MQTLIKKPVISEKSINQGETNKYTFLIADEADKVSVARAIEATYKVEVIKVNIVKLPAKTKRYGKRIGTRSSRKKAVVTLKAGDRIALFEEKA